MYACTHVRMCACTHVRMYACMHVCMHAFDNLFAPVLFQLAVLAMVQRSLFQIAVLAVLAQSGGLEPVVKRGNRGGIGATLISRL